MSASYASLAPFPSERVIAVFSWNATESMRQISSHMLCVALLAIILASSPIRVLADENDSATERLSWSKLPDLPDELGVAGPFVGLHDDALIVAGGANFPRPVWDNNKQWLDRIYVLPSRDAKKWLDAGTLPRKLAYGAAVSTKSGVVCIGGNDGQDTFADVFLMQWDKANKKIKFTDYPQLPQPCVYAQAAQIGTKIFLVGGQSAGDLASATNKMWALDLSQQNAGKTFQWVECKPCPGPARAFHLTVAQHNGYNNCLYVISGRHEENGRVEFLRDVWEYEPGKDVWRSRSEAPTCLMAGSGIGIGQSHILTLGGADGSLFTKSDELRDEHPGFPKKSYAFHTITNTWVGMGSLPANHVTTIPVKWNNEIIIASGEVRPRVRSAAVWAFQVKADHGNFGLINYVVLVGYLLAMVGIGVYFARKTKNTEDYFRGGKGVPWWAAGCSIFATMLSSLTFTGIPSKAYAQDWVYALGNMMIPVVAVLAVFVALPFYRNLDVTSAYEYLERRFSRSVRLFGSLSFTLFHVFRMAVVMSLTGLALAVATPMTPIQAVLAMGILSIIYCTMGGIEAVIWTDTIQTVVLLGGALLAIFLLVSGTEGGFSSAWSTAVAADKLRFVNLHWDATSSQLALWVVIVGGVGQNISSYTADQAVVQRYMTTKDQNLAARSIWTNAVMTIPATIIFFGIGTALFSFYQGQPGKLDPTLNTDQVFPHFIAQEMPIGIAGLIVAGIFSAAQSTVSTSMNSTATTIVTDFLRPYSVCTTDVGYLRAARWITLMIGILGTVLGLVFVSPEIRSLFDTFVRVIGLFMGVLGGLFVLGVMTRRATSLGALMGALVGAGVMFSLWRFSSLNGYLYTACGIGSCVAVGYLTSLLLPDHGRDLKGLTIYTQVS